MNAIHPIFAPIVQSFCPLAEHLPSPRTFEWDWGGGVPATVHYLYTPGEPASNWEPPVPAQAEITHIYLKGVLINELVASRFDEIEQAILESI